MRMHLMLAAMVLIPLGLPAGARVGQDTEELLRKLDRILEKDSERVRSGLLEDLRRDLVGKPAAPPSVAPVPAPALTATLDAASALITEAILKQHATYLASDALEGRASGYPGNVKAAKYIEGVMKRAGLKPAGDAGTFFQKFRVGGKDTNNVVGVLEGSDPRLKNEYVVVGAHFDHVGTSDQRNFGRLGARGNDKIWNGADDNASGTTVLLGIVRAFCNGELKPRRSVVFIGFSGEEAGLIGSRFYASHPVGSIRNHVFMLNLDMVGRNPHRAIHLYGVGSAEGGVLRRAAEKAVEHSGLNARIEDNVKLVGGDSDHSSFRSRRVPFSFFFSGFHADYHRPSDHPEKLAYENMVKVARTSVFMLHEIAEVRPGTADDYGRFVAHDVAPTLARYGHRLVGVFESLLDDTEVISLWATSLDGHIELQRAREAVRGFGDENEDVNSELIRIDEASHAIRVRRREEMMIPCPGSPMGPDAWKS